MSKTVFLSYSRNDDETFVHRLYNDLIRSGFEVWFDRKCMPSRRLTFYQEIREAIFAADRLILVLGPEAVKSKYVCQEWQFAWFAAEKVVIPILRKGIAGVKSPNDFEIVPDELRWLHCEDFRNDASYVSHFEQLCRILCEPLSPLGRLIGVPTLPSNFISRSEIINQLRKGLKMELEQVIVISSSLAKNDLKAKNDTAKPHIGLHGMGGIGKSVLAAAIVRDRQVREVFSDGIVWITIGIAPSIIDLLGRIHLALGGDNSYATEHEGKESLRKLLKYKSVLLVLDDVWQHTHLDFFNVGGARCRLLVTTRDLSLLNTIRGQNFLVELLSDQEALELIAATVGVRTDDLPDEVILIIEECGRLPLAIAICAGILKREINCMEILEQLRSARIDRLADRHAIIPQHRSVWHAIHLGVSFLDTEESLRNYQPRQRFLELAVFPADESIPESAITTLWSHTHGLDYWESKNLLLNFADHALLQIDNITNPNNGETIHLFSLHDLIYDYVQLENNNPINLHAQLLKAYQKKCSNDWISLPDDTYIYSHLIKHLYLANLKDEIHALLRKENEATIAAWYVRLEQFGYTSVYLSDVDFALNITNEDIELQPANAIDHQCLYTLIFASINSLASNIPIKVLIALLRTKIWSAEQALTYALQMPRSRWDGRLKRVHGLKDTHYESVRTEALAVLSLFFAESQLFDYVFRAVRSIDQPLKAALCAARVAAILPTVNALEAWHFSMASAKAINNPVARASLFLTLIKLFPEEKKTALINQALSATQEIENPAKQVISLESLFEVLPKEQSYSARVEAFNAALRIKGEEHRARTLVRLATKQPFEVLDESINIALEAALSYTTNDDKGAFDEYPEWDEQDEIRRDFAISLVDIGKFEVALKSVRATGLRYDDAMDEVAFALVNSGNTGVAQAWRERLRLTYSPKTSVRILLTQPVPDVATALDLALSLTDPITRMKVLNSMIGFISRTMEESIVRFALKAANEIDSYDSHVRDGYLKDLGEHRSTACMPVV